MPNKDLALSATFLSLSIILLYFCHSTDSYSGPTMGNADPNISSYQLLIEPSTYDFSPIGQNETHTAVFKLTNPSNYPVRIVNVTKSCNCNDTFLENELLLDGSSTHLQISYSSYLRTGNFSLPVSIQFRAGERGELMLGTSAELRGHILPDYVVVPNEIKFSNDINEAKVEIAPGKKPLPRLIRATSSTAAVSVAIKSKNEIHVSKISEITDWEKQYVLIETADPTHSWIRIPIESSTR